MLNTKHLSLQLVRSYNTELKYHFISIVACVIDDKNFELKFFCFPSSSIEDSDNCS